MIISGEDREAKAAEWLKRLQEAAALKESLVDYCRRRGLKPGEAYQWKRNLRGAGRWPALASEAANTSRSTAVATAPRFARVRIVPQQCAVSAPLHLQLHLANGRRAELVLSDERQLARVLELLEQPSPDAHAAVYVCVSPVDMRKQAATLALIVEQTLKRNIFEPALYVFSNAQRDRIKIVYWQRNGLCLWSKRLEGRDRFIFPRHIEGETVTIRGEQLEELLEGFDLWRQGHRELLMRRVG